MPRGDHRQTATETQFDRGKVMAMSATATRTRTRRTGAFAAQFIDKSTGMPNRAALMSEIDFALTQESFWVAVLAVHAGPAAFAPGSGRDGEIETVNALGERLRRTLRPTDMVGRLGATDVGAALWNISDPEPVSVVEARVRAAFTEPVRPLGAIRPLVIRIGLGLVPPGGTALMALGWAWSAMHHSQPIHPHRECA